MTRAAECSPCLGEGKVKVGNASERVCEWCHGVGVMTEFLCPACEGHGVFVTEPQDWWHGSGVNAEDHTCSECNGTGEL